MWIAAFLTFVLASAPPPTAEIRPTHGTPMLYINGVRNPATSYMTYEPDEKNFKAFGETGVHLYSFSATPTESSYGLAPLCWKSEHEFDYANLDARAHMLFKSDPDAFFFPRLYLGTPAWWAEQHPDDLVRYDPGDGIPQIFTHLIDSKREGGIASWASEQWRQDSMEAIRKLIRHVEQSDYADRVIGYHLASGTTEEWMQWGSNENLWADYSPVNTARFRKWLRDKYQTDTALKKAWRNLEITLATATIPSKAERSNSEYGSLRDPSRAQAIIDYVTYNSWLVTDTMRTMAHAVKTETNRKRLVGVFYGYVLQLAGEQREQNAGHLALSEVLSCHDIDFITSPSSYVFRQLGTGFPHAMSLVDSVKQHGKLWFDENDYRTWLTPFANVGDFGKTGTYEESLLVQQREFAWTLANRLGMWWFDMGGGWYNDPRMLKEIGKMHRIAQSCMDVDGHSVAEIAFVVDSKSSAYLASDNPFSGEALVMQLPHLGRIGAPFSVVLLADIEHMPHFKLYIFPNCLAPTTKERKVIAKIIKEGAAVIWIGPAGLYRDGQFNPDAMAQLTGLPLEFRTHNGSSRITPLPDTATWGWENAVPFGPVRGMDQNAFPTNDATLKVLGVMEGTQTPALVVREQGNLTVFSPTPALPSGLLRAVARKAGVHLYTENDDIVWASHDLLAISVNQGGKRILHLPRNCTVTDLWTGQIISENTQQITCEIPTCGTALFRLH